ncbi:MULTISPECIES: tautomerase family protein [Rhizobium]|jgi:phenylpyruvate tautomerase PptA (4-oxalocrotonate tautomerase family)|uniref:Tautomerase family protein n=1 Tax=Rhizobium laguerreae TaxID=1076926 RepID=A0A4R3QML4_9HYPH|nr:MULTISPECIES: tautomerase family protein [Rhizobium]MBY3186513.1 tautomerase family protein [Rhizobium laguerreae]MBY3206122.1 tautomerase family protein [Rhizobium laguerreae]MBY3272732.1 tautomerase family protein [Rhizobium laguerreae]MBY3325291.1 tautomerase family protein [Rhizobium laguerreae]MBY3527020.1 tautomerase family protein [Rhizobium laguerreae]
MPLIKINLLKGRSPNDHERILNCIHEAVVSAFNVPKADRYQILYEHERTHVRAEDTGLGISRSDRLIIIEVISRARSAEDKQAFYRFVTSGLSDACAIDPADVVVSIVENGDADWSFGLGRAQFITGELR